MPQAVPLLTQTLTQPIDANPSGSSIRGSDTAERPVDNSLLERLDEAFGQSFVVVDPAQNVLERVSPDWPRADAFRWLMLCEQVSRRGRPEVLEDFAPLLLLATPLNPNEPLDNRVAITVLLTGRVDSVADIKAAARVFGIDPKHACDWSQGRTAWPPHAAIRLAESLLENHTLRHSLQSKKKQLTGVSGDLIATFEELNLLHRLTERLSLDHSTHEICAETIEWLAEVTPADGIVARWFSTDLPEEASPEAIANSIEKTLSAGRLPIEPEELNLFFDRLGPEAQRRSLVLNRDRTSSPTWCYPSIREVVVAPILAGTQVVGWLAAFNHRSGTTSRPYDLTGGTFGSVESSLLSSVASILGVHCGNRQLFHEQETLFEGTVKAFSSALDAKDPYTCGHSDRVARISVRLAQQMGIDQKDLNRLYLGGLLHDIGKIGINDHVLSKPGKLTPEEFDQIKTHPELGERILEGIPQLKSVLAIVRHHHESWDGHGYPDGLMADATPLLARIAAVADALDAMAGDRPYRKGMPIEKVEGILRDGAGQQWDPRVVEAYFTVRDDVRAIIQLERDPHGLDVGRWEVNCVS